MGELVMKGNLLRAPLILTAVIISVASLLIYLTATSSEGSLWSSIGTLIMAAFKIIQLGLGLVVALIFCLAVLTGIFLACVALISRESAAKMLEELRQEISDKLLYVRSLVIRDHPSSGKKVLHEFGEELKKEIQAEMDISLQSMRNNHAAATGYMEKMKEQLERIEINGNNIQSLISRLEKHDDDLQALVAKTEGINTEVQKIQARIDKLSAEMKKEDVEPVVKALDQRIDEIKNQSTSLQDELVEIKDHIATIEAQTHNESRPESVQEEPRLFAHFSNKTMQKRVEELVTATLESDMSYSQVIDHLLEQTTGKTKEILAAHPSLTRDYIRFRRENG